MGSGVDIAVAYKVSEPRRFDRLRRITIEIIIDPRHTDDSELISGTGEAATVKLSMTKNVLLGSK